MTNKQMIATSQSRDEIRQYLDYYLKTYFDEKDRFWFHWQTRRHGLDRSFVTGGFTVEHLKLNKEIFEAMDAYSAKTKADLAVAEARLAAADAHVVQSQTEGH